MSTLSRARLCFLISSRLEKNYFRRAEESAKKKNSSLSCMRSGNYLSRLMAGAFQWGKLCCCSIMYSQCEPRRTFLRFFFVASNKAIVQFVIIHGMLRVFENGKQHVPVGVRRLRCAIKGLHAIIKGIDDDAHWARPLSICCTNNVETSRNTINKNVTRACFVCIKKKALSRAPIMIDTLRVRGRKVFAFNEKAQKASSLYLCAVLA